MRMIIQAGIDLIKSFEQCRLKSYQDQKGVWTIGWGVTGSDVFEGLTITQEQADQSFSDHLQKFCEDVEQAVIVDLNDNQFGALVSLVYNIGAEAFIDSTLLRRLNVGDYVDASYEFLKWNHVNGAVNAGLSRRRLAEKALFMLG